MPHFEAMALGVRGRLHAARGALDLARADLDAAMAIFAELGSRPELDRSRAFAAGLADHRVG